MEKKYVYEIVEYNHYLNSDIFNDENIEILNFNQNYDLEHNHYKIIFKSNLKNFKKYYNNVNLYFDYYINKSEKKLNDLNVEFDMNLMNFKIKK